MGVGTLAVLLVGRKTLDLCTFALYVFSLNNGSIFNLRRPTRPPRLVSAYPVDGKKRQEDPDLKLKE